MYMPLPAQEIGSELQAILDRLGITIGYALQEIIKLLKAVPDLASLQDAFHLYDAYYVGLMPPTLVSDITDEEITFLKDQFDLSDADKYLHWSTLYVGSRPRLSKDQLNDLVALIKDKGLSTAPAVLLVLKGFATQSYSQGLFQYKEGIKAPRAETERWIKKALDAANTLIGFVDWAQADERDEDGQYPSGYNMDEFCERFEKEQRLPALEALKFDLIGLHSLLSGHAESARAYLESHVDNNPDMLHKGKDMSPVLKLAANGLVKLLQMGGSTSHVKEMREIFKTVNVNVSDAAYRKEFADPAVGRWAGDGKDPQPTKK